MDAPGCMTSLRWYFILQAESGHCENAEGPEPTQRPMTNALKPFFRKSLAGSLIHRASFRFVRLGLGLGKYICLSPSETDDPMGQKQWNMGKFTSAKIVHDLLDLLASRRGVARERWQGRA